MGFEEFQDEDHHDELYDQPMDADCTALATAVDAAAPAKEKLTGLAAFEAEYEEVLFLMNKICRAIVIKNKASSAQRVRIDEQQVIELAPRIRKISEDYEKYYPLDKEFK